MKKLMLLALLVVAASCSNGGTEDMGEDLIGAWVAPDIVGATPSDMKVIGKKNLVFSGNFVKPHTEQGSHSSSAYRIPKEGVIQVAQRGYFGTDQYSYEYTYWFNGDALHFKYTKKLGPGLTDLDTPGTEYVYNRSE